MTTTSNQARVGRSGAVTFHHPVAFWFGVVAVTAGVLLHIPMYLMGQHNGYRLAGMPMDNGMLFGMAAIVVGLCASLYGLYPNLPEHRTEGIGNLRIHTMDDAPIGWAHIGMLLTMAVAITIDITGFPRLARAPRRQKLSHWNATMEPLCGPTTVRLKVEQIQLVSGVKRFDLGCIGLQGA